MSPPGATVPEPRRTHRHGTRSRRRGPAYRPTAADPRLHPRHGPRSRLSTHRPRDRRGRGAGVLVQRPRAARQPRAARSPAQGPHQAPGDRDRGAKARRDGGSRGRPDRRRRSRPRRRAGRGARHRPGRLRLGAARALRPRGPGGFHDRGRHPRRGPRGGAGAGRSRRRRRRRGDPPRPRRGRGDREATEAGPGKGHPRPGEPGTRALRHARGRTHRRQGGGGPPQALGSGPDRLQRERMSEPTTSTALERAIRSQPDELRRLLAEPVPHEAIERLGEANRIWLVGTGTSEHAAELGASMLHEAGRAAQATSSMRFVTWGPPIDPRDAVILISHNAGVETAYAWTAYLRARDAGLPVVAITRRGGEIPDAVETVEQERSHTYTVSYTGALVVLARLAHALGARGFSAEILDHVPSAVEAAISSPGTEHLAAPPRLLVLFGEGPASITAREGAPKCREAARFPAEGYDVEFLLHGNAVPITPEDHL